MTRQVFSKCFARAYQAATTQNEDISRNQANIVLSPDVAKFTSTEYDKSALLIAAGYHAAEAQRAILSKYALTDADWKLYVDDRATRRRSRPGFIHNVIVEDETSHTSSLVKAANHELAGKPFEQERTDRFVTGLRGNWAPRHFTRPFVNGRTEGLPLQRISRTTDSRYTFVRTETVLLISYSGQTWPR